MLGWLAVASAALVAVAAFLVWAKVSGLGESIEIKGIGDDAEGADTGANDGVLTLILAIAAAVLGIVRGLGRWALGAAITILVCGAITVMIALADIGDVSDLKDIAPEGVTVDVGIGLTLTLVGGLVMTVVGIVGIVKRR